MKKMLPVILLVLLGASCGLGRIKICSIPPCSLDHRNNSTAAMHYNRWESEFSFTMSSEDRDLAMIAPVSLANGATVKKLVAYVTDNTDGSAAVMSVRLGRHDLATGACETMASVDTSADSASPEVRECTAAAILFARIDNDRYSYHLAVVFGKKDPNLKFHGAKIYY